MGCSAICLLLAENPKLNLAQVLLDHNMLTDADCAVLSNVLRKNTTLNTLKIHGNSITQLRWSSFSKVLCNESSIADICSSNHTLYNLGTHSRSSFPNQVQNSCPRYLQYLLFLNQNEDKAADSRQKILNVYFHQSDYNIEIFVKMVIYWMGKNYDTIDIDTGNDVSSGGHSAL